LSVQQILQPRPSRGVAARLHVKKPFQAIMIVKVLFLSVLAISMLLPFYWVLISSFKSNSAIFGRPFDLPTTLDFGSFSQAFRSANIPLALINSLIYCICAIFLALLFSAMVSYVIAKIRKSKFLYMYFSFGILIPIHAIIIPLNVILNTLHIGNTRIGLILVFVVANISLSVFILTAAMRNIPDELLQAAAIDGCHGAQTFFRIALPVCKPALATAGTLAFVGCWNDFLLSLIVANNPAIRTINLAVYNLRSTFTDDYSILCAGMTTMIIPAVIVYTIFQEQIIKGMVSGAVKG
jgi:raffinose/stachyose/melibiose transport system permease protein